jgi:F-type H+-transporting ATPase subunit a
MDLSHPILFYLAGIPVRDTVVYTWITMGVIVGIVLILKVFKPNLLEMILEAVISVVDDAMDVDELHPYIPLLGSLLIFVMTANLISILPGMKSPTSDLNTTVAGGGVLRAHLWDDEKRRLEIP